MFSCRGMQRDHRDRRNRVVKRNQAFQLLLPGLVDAYLHWAAKAANSCFPEHQDQPAVDDQDIGTESYKIQVIDVFRSYFHWMIVDCH